MAFRFPSDTPGATPSIDSEIDFTANSQIETPCPKTTPPLPHQDEKPHPPDSTILFPNTGPHSLKHCRLQNSLQTLRQRLEASRGLISNLRTRNEIQRIDQNAAQERAREIEVATTEMEQNGKEASGSNVSMVLGLMLCLVLGYLWWCWYNRPEMEYVRRRQREVLGL